MRFFRAGTLTSTPVDKKIIRVTLKTAMQKSPNVAKSLKVDRGAFDAILGKLIATPPKPATQKRKARKAPAKRKAQ